MVCEVHFSLEKLRIKHAQARSIYRIVQVPLKTGVLISIMKIDERDALMFCADFSLLHWWIF